MNLQKTGGGWLNLRMVHAFTILGALSACVEYLNPAFPVTEPLAEETAMQQQMQEQLPILARMACLSAAAYRIKDNSPDAGYCHQFEQGPGITMQTFQVRLADIWGYEHVDYYKLLIDEMHREQIISVRGTIGWEDWYTNIQFKPVIDDVLNVPVHRGFRMYARDLWSVLGRDGTDVLGNPKRPLNRTYKTYVTGHSLGGAAAVLLALYLYQEKPVPFKIAGVYTFGQPRIFDNRGATSWPRFAENVYHVENCQDPVPLVPVGNDLLHFFLIDPLSARVERAQYQHIGREILLLNPGKYWIPGGNELVRNTILDAIDIYEDLRAGKPTDHDIQQYIERIRALREASPSAAPVNPSFHFQQNCGARLPETVNSALGPEYRS